MWICRDGKSLTLILYAFLLDKQLKMNNKKSPTGGSSSSTVLPVKDKSNSSCRVLLKTFLSLVDGDQKVSPPPTVVRFEDRVWFPLEMRAETWRVEEVRTEMDSGTGTIGRTDRGISSRLDGWWLWLQVRNVKETAVNRKMHWGPFPTNRKDRTDGFSRSCFPDGMWDEPKILACVFTCTQPCRERGDRGASPPGGAPFESKIFSQLTPGCQ